MVKISSDHTRNKNYGTLHYEEITSPFLLFKSYLNIISKVIFNYCDKYLLIALFAREDHSSCFTKYNAFSATNCFSERKKKFKEKIYLNAVKLIRKLVVSTCQSANAYAFINCFRTYEPGVHYNSPYLSIDRLKKKKKEMNNFCICFTDALSKRFNIDAIVFVSKKKKDIRLSLNKPLFEYRNYKSIITFIRNYFEERRFFCEPYILNFPRLNQSIKWRLDYILAIKKVNKKL